MTSTEARAIIEGFLTGQGYSRKEGGKNTYFEKERKRYRLSRTTVKPQVYIEGIGWSNAARPAMSLIRVAKNLQMREAVPVPAPRPGEEDAK